MTEVKKENWFKNVFFPSKEEIEEKAKNYDTSPWYKQRKYILSIFMVLASGLGVFVYGFEEALISLALIMPILFLMIRGYRFGYVAVIIFWTIEKILQFSSMPQYTGSIILWWVFVFVVAVNGIRIEGARKRLKLEGKSTVIRDVIISIVLFLVLSFSSVYMMTDKVSKDRSYEIGLAAGFIYRNTNGYSEFCSKNGYELVKYPEAFKKAFATEIEKSNRLISEAWSVEEFNEFIKKDDNNEMYNSIKAEFDVARKDFIIGMLSKEMNVNLELFQWQDEYYKYMDYTGFCGVFDNLSEEIIKEDPSGDLTNFKNLIDNIE